MSNNKGFTLVELLIVVALVAIIAAIALIFIIESTAKARDSQRVSEAEAIAEALRLYYLDYEEYPSQGDGYNGYIGIGGSLDTALEFYLGYVPADPKHDAAMYYYYYDAYHICTGLGSDAFAMVSAYTFETDDYNDGFRNLEQNCPSGWGGEGGSSPDYVVKLYPSSL